MYVSRVHKRRVDLPRRREGEYWSGRQSRGTVCRPPRGLLCTRIPFPPSAFLGSRYSRRLHRLRTVSFRSVSTSQSPIYPRNSLSSDFHGTHSSPPGLSPPGPPGPSRQWWAPLRSMCLAQLPKLMLAQGTSLPESDIVTAAWAARSTLSDRS